MDSILFGGGLPKNLRPGEAIQDAPMGEILRSLATAIADAQAALDANSIRSGVKLGTTTVELDGSSRSLLSLGFTPTFYHFTNATVSVDVTLTLKFEEEIKVGFKFNEPKEDGSPGGTAPSGSTPSPAVASKGTVTIKDVTKLKEGETLSVGANKLTFIPSGPPAANQIVIPAPGTNPAAFATTLLVALQAKPFSDEVSATASAAVLTLEAVKKGKAGDSLKLEYAGPVKPPGITVSGAKLDGGGEGKKASGRITVSVVPGSGDKLTLGTRTITFVKDATTKAEEIQIGADPAGVATSIVAKINDTLKDTLTASLDGTTAVKVEAAKEGADGNNIGLAFAAASTAGGGLEVKKFEGGKDEVKAGDKPATGGTPAPAEKAKVEPEKSQGLRASGISVSADYHRKFSVDTTSTTKITATLVSIPAPKEFFELLKATFTS